MRTRSYDRPMHAALSRSRSGRCASEAKRRECHLRTTWRECARIDNKRRRTWRPVARAPWLVLPWKGGSVRARRRPPRVRRFFYKYDPLSNIFVKNSPLRILLPNMTWREEEKVPRVAFRHSVWRIKVIAYRTGGKHIPPLALAGVWLATLCSFPLS
jgi:hypothetical protein